jgi:hypothetical protein
LVAITEGPLPNFNEAFTQLHLGQLLALVKYTRGDRRDGGIDPNADDITRRSLSTKPSEDEDLVGINIVHVRHRAPPFVWIASLPISFVWSASTIRTHTPGWE